MELEEKIDIDSIKSVLNFMNTEWKLIYCPINSHNTMLSKICIDGRCNK